MLIRSEQITGSAQSEIEFCQLEAVVRFGKCREPLTRRLGNRIIDQHGAIARLRAAANAPPQLVELRKPNRCGESMTISVAFATSTPTSITEVDTSTCVGTAAKLRHRPRFFGRGHLAVNDSNAKVGEFAVGQPLEGRGNASGRDVF